MAPLPIQIFNFLLRDHFAHNILWIIITVYTLQTEHLFHYDTYFSFMQEILCISQVLLYSEMRQAKTKQKNQHEMHEYCELHEHNNLNHVFKNTDNITQLWYDAVPWMIITMLLSNWSHRLIHRNNCKFLAHISTAMNSTHSILIVRLQLSTHYKRSDWHFKSIPAVLSTIIICCYMPLIIYFKADCHSKICIQL